MGGDARGVPGEHLGLDAVRPERLHRVGRARLGRVEKREAPHERHIALVGGREPLDPGGLAAQRHPEHAHALLGELGRPFRDARGNLAGERDLLAVDLGM